MRTWLALALSLAVLFNASGAGGKQTEGNRKVYVVPVRDDIMPPMVYLVRRGVKAAMEAKAELLVLDMKTNGGRLDSAEEIMEILDQFKGETATYVNDRAFSAGVFLAVATKKIYMAPQSVIGAAAPIMLGPSGSVEKTPETFEVKMTSAVRALVRRAAEKNGYNTDVIEAMIDKNKPLDVNGTTLSKQGDILTLTDSEAKKTYGDPPKPLLSSGTVDSIEELLKLTGHSAAAVIRIQPTGVETIGTWLNRLSPLWLILGVLGIYLELKTPGFGLPGIVGISAFALYFFGSYVAGLSGLEWVAIFSIGLALLVVEFFVFPGTVLPGLTGFALMFVALVMAMVDIYPGGPWLPTVGQLRLPLENFLIALIGTALGVWLLSLWVPKTTLYHQLVSTSSSGEISVVEQHQSQAKHLGDQGVALSGLRPSGKAQFGEDIVDVITQGELIPKESKVRIIGYSGGVAVVEETNRA